MSLLGSAWSVLRHEGPLALRDRVAERVGELRRQRAFADVGVDSAAAPAAGLPHVPILNLLDTPPESRFGGVPGQFANRIAEERRARPVAVFFPQGVAFRVEVSEGSRRVAFRLSRRAAPTPLALADAELETRVLEAAARLEVRAAHVEGAAGWPLQSLLNLKRAGLGLVLSLHDFGLFCARPHLLEVPSHRFCDFSRDDARCARCLAQSWPAEAASAEARRRVAAALYGAADALVFSSSYLRDAHAELFGGARPEATLVSTPAVALPETPPRRPPRRGSETRVAFVGAVKLHKGAHVLEEVAGRLAGEPFTFRIYGGGDEDLLARLAPRCGVRGYYRLGALPSLLARDGVDVALLLSVVPESYSQTLTECHAAGVPVVAFDLGALGRRLAEEGGGIAVPIDRGADGIVEALRAFRRGATIPLPPPPADSRRAAAETHLALYRRLGLLGGPGARSDA